MSAILEAADLFAGWGGTSTGLERAGIPVRWAANHWPLAVAVHEANHPNTIHVCQDLNQADFTGIPRVRLVTASPACQGNSRASQPKRRRYHDAMRSTAWAVVSAADVMEPEFLVIENVLDFRKWRLYSVWCDALRELGYHLTENVLHAGSCGAHQRRTRLFIVGSLHRPLWLRDPGRAERPFAECIEWNVDHDSWAPVDSKSAAVQDRVARGRAKWGRTFLSQHVTNHSGVPLDQAIRTITTKDQWCLVDGDLMRPLSIREHTRAMGLPDSYKLPEGLSREAAIRGIGNAVHVDVATEIGHQIQAAA